MRGLRLVVLSPTGPESSAATGVHGAFNKEARLLSWMASPFYKFKMSESDMRR